MIRSISCRRIIYIESRGHEVIIHGCDGDIVITDKLINIKEKLPSNFFQCHKSYIINLDFVKKIEKTAATLCGLPNEKNKDETKNVLVNISRINQTKTKKKYLDYIQGLV